MPKFLDQLLSAHYENLTADPASPSRGRFWFRTDGTPALKYYNGSATKELADLNTAQTLTNKTIDAASNTLSNVANSAISSSAAITRSKIASGTNYRILANSSSGVMSENAALTATHVVYADANGQLAGEAQLTPTRGGTGLASFSTGAMLYASGANTWAALAAGASGTVLKMGASIPAWTSSAQSVATAAKDHFNNGDAISNAVDSFTVDTTTTFSMTLPDCASNPGKVFYFKKISSDYNLFQINRAGGDTIQGSATPGTSSTTIATIGEELLLQSFGGTVWQIVQRRIPSNPTATTATIQGSVSNPTKGTVSPDLFSYWREGQMLVMMCSYRQTSSGADGSGTYLFLLPNSLSMDTSFVTADVNIGNGCVGAAAASIGTATYSTGYVKAYSTTQLALVLGNETTAPQFVSNTFYGLGTSGVRLSFQAKVPISGWNG